ncbi:DUF3017 domain-containing protein [Nocardioides perillae]|uniref:DUF3017 domain-containing protein n=1 Tax=Nocardioides perillae TaxID=1119534 RepID=A0A7Y9RVW6_9ACTN|nr:hypothetical protein [Nocardioides perillae]
MAAQGSPDPGIEPGVEPEPRRYPSTLGGACYLLVLLATAVGLVLVAVDDWRTGVRWVGGALLAAAVLRLVLRERDAGMLAVRHRGTDALLLSAMGATLVFLAGSVPDQPPPL